MFRNENGSIQLWLEVKVPGRNTAIRNKAGCWATASSPACLAAVLDIKACA